MAADVISMGASPVLINAVNMFGDKAMDDCQFGCCDCVCSQVINSQVGVGWAVGRGRA
jgi:hypothetical protein